MKNKHLLCLCAFLMLFVAKVGAQSSLDRFSQLKSQGPFPTDFKKILIEDKAMTDYNVFLQELVMDGNILYGTKLNDYLNTVVDNLLKDDLALRSKIHVYIMRSASVNAFSTDNGLLIVNLGLLAQVSNESELAFVLAHEIAHYAEHHVSKLNDYRDTLKDRNMILNYLRFQNRSREQEMAADRLAIERFYDKTPYSYEAVDGVFDVLLYSDLPFDEVPFTNNLMETNFYQFPNNYFLANVNPISSRADNLDTLLTHPNIEKRRGALQPLLANKSNAGRSVFVQSEELFNEVRELARFECLNIFLTEHFYDKALYNAYVLKRQHPDNAFLDEVVVTALYGFSKHKNYGKIGDVIQPYKNVEGEMQQTSYFLSKLNRQESSLLAFRFAWAAKEKYPEKRYFEEVAKDVMKDIVVKNKLKYNDFSDYPMGTIPDSIKLEEKPTLDTATNKYSRIKNQKAPSLIIPTEKFKTMNFMLVDIHQLPEFVAMMNDVKNTTDDEAILNAVSTKQASEMKRMIVAEPQYVVKTMKHKRLTFNQKRSEQGSKRLTKTVKTCLKRLHVESVYYAKEDVCSFNTEQYNAYAQLQHWLYEYAQADCMQMIYNGSKDLSSVYDLTGTMKVCQVVVNQSFGNFISIDKTNGLAYAVLCPYVVPAALLTLALPRYSEEMYIVVADLETGKTHIGKHDSKISVMRDAYINSFMYDKLYEFMKGK